MDINESFKSPFTTPQNVTDLVTTFLNISFVLAGLILLFFFIMGGVKLMSSAGSQNSQDTEQAKKTITSALIGFIVVFASYWIVKLIGSITGTPILQ